jgi:DNA-binding XRE family transcriptional regulator
MGKTTSRVADLGKEWMSDPEFRAEYDALAEEFALAEALVDARANTNLTQDQIAERMGTSRTAVVRLESGRGNPSLRTFQRYAKATGTKLRLSFVPQAPTAAR